MRCLEVRDHGEAEGGGEVLPAGDKEPVSGIGWRAHYPRAAIIG